MDAMRVDRTLAQQTIAVIHVEVAACLRKQLLHPRDFIEVLGNVRLDEGIRVVRGEPRDARQLCVRGSGSEARGDRVQQSIPTMPRLEQLACVTLTNLGGVAQILRAVS